MLDQETKESFNVVGFPRPNPYRFCLKKTWEKVNFRDVFNIADEATERNEVHDEEDFFKFDHDTVREIPEGMSHDEYNHTYLVDRLRP